MTCGSALARCLACCLLGAGASSRGRAAGRRRRTAVDPPDPRRRRQTTRTSCRSTPREVARRRRLRRPARRTPPTTRSPSGVETSNPSTLAGGNIYGSQLLHLPVAGRAGRSRRRPGSEPPRGRSARDLLRAQISVVSWTYAIKFAADRTRPNGDPRSFPSGHASTSFATAMVLQEHYGWKLGLPAFLAGAPTPRVSRVAANQHWASDVVFGAAVGIASGRTVTLHLREHAAVGGAARGARRRRCARHGLEVAMKRSGVSLVLVAPGSLASAPSPSAQDQDADLAHGADRAGRSRRSPST